MLSAGAAKTIDAMRSAGRLEAIDEALVAAYLALASELDRHRQVAGRSALFREFRAYHDALMAVGVTEDGDGIDDLLASLSTEVGNTAPPRPSN